MPKQFKKRSLAKSLLYDRSKLNDALEAVRNRRLSVWRAAEEFGVPKSTLHDRISGKYGEETRPGRKPALPDYIENKIVEAVKEASRQGVGVSRRQLLVRTGELCRQFKVTPFKKATPTNDW